MLLVLFLGAEDAVADTFYSIGLVMRVCQSLSALELLHIWLGLEEDRLVPKLFQVRHHHGNNKGYWACHLGFCVCVRVRVCLMI